MYRISYTYVIYVVFWKDDISEEKTQICCQRCQTTGVRARTGRSCFYLFIFFFYVFGFSFYRPSRKDSRPTLTPNVRRLSGVFTERSPALNSPVNQKMQSWTVVHYIFFLIPYIFCSKTKWCETILTSSLIPNSPFKKKIENMPPLTVITT